MEGLTIIISETDLETAREKVKPKDPKTIEIENVSTKAIAITSDRLNKATSLSDFIRWHHATLNSLPKSISWMWEMPPTPPPSIENAEEIATDILDTRFQGMFEKDANVAIYLMEELNKMEDKPDKVKIGIKKVRDSHKNVHYQVIGMFPSGTRVPDPILDNYFSSTKAAGSAQSNIIFFEPQNACSEHDCYDLYVAHKDPGSTSAFFYIDNETYDQAYSKLKADENGVVEYVIQKTAEEVVKQDDEASLLFALLGGYNNEPFRVRISDFKSHMI